MITIDDVDNLLADTGSGDVVLRRLPSTDVTCRAKVSGYRAQELVGNIQQGDQRVIISNSEISAAVWPQPPRKGDKVIINGHSTTVQACETIVLDGITIMHTIQVRG